MIENNDLKYMSLAVELASMGEGRANPNPLVGALVVKDGEIIGRGYHKFYGGPHAEVYAIDEAGENAEGATIYVTLEPCSHYGKTPPCVNKIISAGIKRCVVGILDPNPLVAGKGIQILREAGIEVETDILRKECFNINRVFFKYIETKMPYIFVKCGITLDGKLATRTFSSKWITNSQAREKVQRYRNKFSGIMVGFNTALQDDPSLTCRMEGGRNPYRLVMDPDLKLPLSHKIFLNNRDEKTIILTKNIHSKDEKYHFLKEQCKVRFIEFDSEVFPTEEMFKKIGSLGIDSVLVEGGSTLLSSLLREDMADGGEIFVAPKILGDEKAVSFISGFSPASIDEGFILPNAKINIYGNNIGFEFYKK